MKNLTNLIFMMVVILLSSCTNERTDDVLSQNISEIQYFNSRTDFENKMKTIKMNDDNQLNNDYNILSEVLNKDNIIGIGEYLIKVDLKTESVYTLKKSLQNEYEDLANINLNNSNINQFSIYTDVLSTLNGNNNNISSRRQYCPPASFKQDSDSSYENNRSINVGTKYFSSGIYFFLQYQCTTSNSGYNKLVELDYSMATTNCITTSRYLYNDEGDGENERDVYAYIYFGTTPLSSYHCAVVFSSSAGVAKATIND